MSHWAEGKFFWAPTNGVLLLLAIPWLFAITAFAVQLWEPASLRWYDVVVSTAGYLFGIYLLYAGTRWWAWIGSDEIKVPYRKIRLGDVASASVKPTSAAMLYGRTVPVLTLRSGGEIVVKALAAPRVFRTQRRFVDSINEKLATAVPASTPTPQER